MNEQTKFRVSTRRVMRWCVFVRLPPHTQSTNVFRVMRWCVFCTASPYEGRALLFWALQRTGHVRKFRCIYCSVGIYSETCAQGPCAKKPKKGARDPHRGKPQEHTQKHDPEDICSRYCSVGLQMSSRSCVGVCSCGFPHTHSLQMSSGSCVGVCVLYGFPL